MKTNKNISIDIEILKEMLEYCEKYNVVFVKYNLLKQVK